MIISQARSQLDNWGRGHIFIYSCSAQLVSFEIDCFYGLQTRIYEYVPLLIIELATGLLFPLNHYPHYFNKGLFCLDYFELCNFKPFGSKQHIMCTILARY